MTKHARFTLFIEKNRIKTLHLSTLTLSTVADFHRGRVKRKYKDIVFRVFTKYDI